MDHGLAISLGLLAAGTAVSAAVCAWLRRSGASLRPGLWLGGLFALIVLPQVAGHLWLDLQRGRAVQVASPFETAADRQAAAAGPSSQPFGDGVDPSQLVDVRQTAGGAFAAAETAQFALLAEGETVLLAQFPDADAATRAWQAYREVSGLDRMPARGDAQRGLLVHRAAGDRAYLLQQGRWLGLWAGRDDATIRRRLQAGGFQLPAGSPLATAAETPGDPRDALWPRSLPMRALAVAGIALYLIVVVLAYFKGAAWAGTVAAAPGVPRVSGHELRARLYSVNALDVPLHLEPGDAPDELVASWRHDDAAWIDGAGVHAATRTFRIRLRLDEHDGAVRSTDEWARFDVSAGAGLLELEWRASLGIVFFQVEHERVLGLQLGPHGRFEPRLDHAWRFDLQALKSPLVLAVTQAGWTWRPTVWRGPRWLHWLTA